MTQSIDEKRPLWAPWRIEFIRSKKEPGCFLCSNNKQFKETEESLMIAKCEHVFVILNRYPYTSGHIMVAPYKHTSDLSELSPEERHEIIDTAARVIDLLKKVMHPDGFNTGFNLGVAAGAGVADHLHFHVVPRWVGDNNFMPVLGDVRVVPEALEATALLLRNAWNELYS